jgi:biotin carboxylase
VPRIVLLLPTGTYRASDFVDAAAAVGAEVVVVSDERQALSETMGDRALVVDFGRPEAAADLVIESARGGAVDGVVAVDDQGVLVAARAAAALGLRHNPVEAVAATRDKATMRRCFAGRGVPQPDFREVGRLDDDRRIAALAAQVGFPVVVKPVSLSASRGVIRADSAAAAVAAAARVRQILACADDERSGDDTLLIERYVPGDEVAVEGLLRGGTLHVLAVFDKPDPLEGPYFEETIYVTPSRHPEAVVAAVVGATAAAAAALGLLEGPIHAELRVDGARVTVLEVAARSIGGLCSRTLRFGMGVSLEEVIVRHALGLPIDDLNRQHAASGVMMLPIPSGGTLTAVGGRDEAAATPGIVGLEITVPIGRAVVPLPEGDRYLGFLFATGDAPEAVEASLRTAHSRLTITIEGR